MMAKLAKVLVFNVTMSCFVVGMFCPILAFVVEGAPEFQLLFDGRAHI